jgi:hypothetical protein
MSLVEAAPGDGNRCSADLREWAAKTTIRLGEDTYPVRCSDTDEVST